jgi:hypothetical protein
VKLRGAIEPIRCTNRARNGSRKRSIDTIIAITVRAESVSACSRTHSDIANVGSPQEILFRESSHRIVKLRRYVDSKLSSPCQHAYCKCTLLLIQDSNEATAR